MTERGLAGWSARSTPAPACVFSHSTHLALFNITLTHTTPYTTKRLKKQMNVVCTVRGFVQSKTRNVLDHPKQGTASSKKNARGNILVFTHFTGWVFFQWRNLSTE
jgi:hypothetical protein